MGDFCLSVTSKIISYFNFSICSWVRPEYFMIRLMSTPSASIFLAISRAFWFMPFSIPNSIPSARPSCLPSCFAVSMEFLISRYAILLASYSPHFLWRKHIFFYLFQTIFIIVYAMVVSLSAMKDTKTQTESHRSALTSFTEFLS